MNRTELERPFEAALVKTRRGAFGQTISYVEGTEYVRRLNDAFEGEWSFEVVEHHVHDDEVVVVGRLTAAGVTKMAFGGTSITTSSTTGEGVSLADDLKAAATDALKKAASMFGVGLSLYSDPPRAETSKPAVPIVPSVPGPRSVQRSRRSEPRRGDGGVDGDGHKPNGNRLTQRQLAAIWSIGRHLEVSADELRRRSVEAFGVVPEHLTKPDASAFITELQSISGGNGAAS